MKKGEHAFVCRLKIKSSPGQRGSVFFSIEPNFSRRLKESAPQGGLLLLPADGRGLLLVARSVSIRRARPLRA